MPPKKNALLPTLTSFPYDASANSLAWLDTAHTENAQHTYCYCGTDKRPNPHRPAPATEPMLKCNTCANLFHPGCVNCLPNDSLLDGDSFYTFRCSVCGKGKQTFERAAMSWVAITHLALYNLLLRNPDKEFMRWKEDICQFIDAHWEYLKPGKAKSATWNNTVASVLSVAQGKVFRSGTEECGVPGFWSLSVMEPPLTAAGKPSGPKPKSGTLKAATPKAGTPKSAATSRKSTASPLASATTAKRTMRRAASTDQHLSSKPARPPAKSQSGLGMGKSLPVSAQQEDNVHDGWSFPRKRKQDNDDEDSGSLPYSKKIKTETTTEEDHRPSTGRKGVGQKSYRAKSLSRRRSSASSDSDIFGDSDSELSVLSSLEDSDEDDRQSSNQPMHSKQVRRDVNVKLENGQQSTHSPRKQLGTTRPSQALPGDSRLDDKQEDGTDNDDDLEENAMRQPGTARTVAETATRNTRTIKVQYYDDPFGDLSDEAEDDDEEDDDDEDEADDSDSSEDNDDDDVGNEEVVSKEEPVIVASVARDKHPRPRPKPIAPAHHTLLTPEQEHTLLQHLNSHHSSSTTSLPPAVLRLRRKIHLRRLKRTIGLRLLDLDAAVSRSLRSNAKPLTPLLPHRKHLTLLPSVVTLPNGRPARLTIRGMDDKSALSRFRAVKGVTKTQYNNSFLSRLYGNTQPTRTVSPYTGRILLPHIWEPHHLATSTPAHQTLVAIAPTTAAHPITFTHLTPRTLPHVNTLLSNTFWPGINVMEALQYPDFTIVATHARHLVVAVAIMTPDAYLSYIAVRNGWEGAGLARFMLWYLIAAVPGKDITLHVSANNKAMVSLCRGIEKQKMGHGDVTC
ncbi:hypothetical protein PhCBS80983_g05993 [Powellomyces hirtus]|uniref:N-acetyltransferase domain-containing protein n=1 Tax=Powellomyces hirtus TaxID=109895 RepID=A0A507DSM9_9FUNG|nr:hypothetical protein PhCBS80983_g05993 [Powellomyces hirtus]